MAKCPNPKSCPKDHLKEELKAGACSKCPLQLSEVEPEGGHLIQQIIGAVAVALLLALGGYSLYKYLYPDVVVPKPLLLFTLSGSNTIGAELMPTLVERFLTDHTKLTGVKPYQRDKNDLLIYGKGSDGKELGIEIKSLNSSSGFTDLRNGQANAIMSSRPIRPNDNLSDMQEVVLCNDALAIIVHKNQSINSLDMQQLSDIFSGNAPDFKKVCVRDSASGTFDFFNQQVLKRFGKKLTPNCKRFDSNDKLVFDVEQNPEWIGFVSYQAAKQREKYVKILAVSDGHGAIAFTPDEHSIKSESYPLTRRLYLYYSKKNAGLNSFKQFLLKDESQKECEKYGFFGITTEEVLLPFQPIAGVVYPTEYTQLVSEMKTMPYNIRFAFNQFELDTKGQQDGDKAVAWFKKHPTKRPVLVGFADSIGYVTYNQKLSVDRAAAFKTYLESKGIACDDPKGFGKQIPVGDNTSEDGRARNRRVEIWVK